jgi:acyl carrier protein
VISLTQHELAELIIQWVKENKQSADFPDSQISVGTDLMAVGLLDSFGFVDLVLFLEEQCGTKINLVDVDPSEFTVVKGLCNITLANAVGAYEQCGCVTVTNGVQQLPS